MDPVDPDPDSDPDSDPDPQHCNYLREFSKKVEMILMEYSGARRTLIHKKTEVEYLVSDSL
jgi:hypothetical protein